MHNTFLAVHPDIDRTTTGVDQAPTRILALDRSPETLEKIARTLWILPTKILKFLLPIFIIGLSGCAINDVERHARLSYLANIQTEFQTFVSNCRFTAGHLFVPRQRVPNAPPTPWEMQDAVCHYGDAYPLRFVDETTVANALVFSAR